MVTAAGWPDSPAILLEFDTTHYMALPRALTR